MTTVLGFWLAHRLVAHAVDVLPHSSPVVSSLVVGEGPVLKKNKTKTLLVSTQDGFGVEGW